MGFSKARTLEWGAFPVSRGIFPIRGWNPGLPHCRRILYQLSHEGSTSLYVCTYIYVLLRKRKKYTRTLVETASLVSATQLCLTLCDPMDCSPPGSSVHGILQASILERVAMPSSKRSSRPRDQTHVSCIGRWILYP